MMTDPEAQAMAEAQQRAFDRMEAYAMEARRVALGHALSSFEYRLTLHARGMDRVPEHESYRNHYYAAPDTAQCHAWVSLCERGLAAQTENAGQFWSFYVTAAGKQAMADYVKVPPPAKATLP